MFLITASTAKKAVNSSKVLLMYKKFEDGFILYNMSGTATIPHFEITWQNQAYVICVNCIERHPKKSTK